MQKQQMRHTADEGEGNKAEPDMALQAPPNYNTHSAAALLHPLMYLEGYTTKSCCLYNLQQSMSSSFWP